MTAEKNDVDISKLFEYKAEVELETPDGEKVTLYMRLLGDADVNKSRVESLRASAEMRANLLDRKWKNRSAYIPDISKQKKDEIVDSIVSLRIREITGAIAKKLRNDSRLRLPEDLPSDATREEQEEHQKVFDDFPGKYQDLLQEEIFSSIEDVKKQLFKKTKEVLLIIYRDILIQELCEDIFASTFRAWFVFLGTYIDEDYTVRAFKSFDVYNNSHEVLKKRLVEAYNKLELSSTELKK